MVTKQSKPSRLKVDIWVEGKGFDVDQLSLGETGLTYHIRIRSNKGRWKTANLKSVAVKAGASPLVVFAHATPLEWKSSVRTIRKQPGTAQIDIDVNKNITGSSTLQALELVMPDPFSPTGTATEVVALDLPLTVA